MKPTTFSLLILSGILLIIIIYSLITGSSVFMHDNVTKKNNPISYWSSIAIFVIVEVCLIL